MKEYILPIICCAFFLILGVLTVYNAGSEKSKCQKNHIESITTNSSSVKIVLDNGGILIINTK
jgi:hypothetical protein